MNGQQPLMGSLRWRDPIHRKMLSASVADSWDPRDEMNWCEKVTQDGAHWQDSKQTNWAAILGLIYRREQCRNEVNNVRKEKPVSWQVRTQLNLSNESMVGGKTSKTRKRIRAEQSLNGFNWCFWQVHWKGVKRKLCLWGHISSARSIALPSD